MKHQDEYRNPRLISAMAMNLRKMAEKLSDPVSFMEVCGTHTMSIYRYGLRSLLPDNVRLVSGPGCPVCVTPASYVDKALACARIRGNIVATFGDMMRVPGSASSLMEARGEGGDVRIVYSPLDALEIAKRNRDKKVVFLGVGFETTAPAVAAAILEGERLGVPNFCVLAAHKTMPLPMELLSSDPELSLSGYICPAHVSVIIGGNAYLPIVGKHRIPCVVTGFEPADLLQGVSMLLSQVMKGEAGVEIQYSRGVSPNGNPRALEIMNRVFEPCDAIWRGVGMIPGSGLSIRNRFSGFDAERIFDLDIPVEKENSACRCGDVLKGKLSPFDCPLFGSSCTPEEPVGACMVSSEGTCAAAYKYGR